MTILQTLIPSIDRSHAVAHSRAHFGQGAGPVVYDNLGCMGTEADLSECRHTPFGHSDCKHDEDAGVTCGRVISLSLFFLLQYKRTLNLIKSFCDKRPVFYHNFFMA